MTGRIIREGHTCSKPAVMHHQHGAIWQCDCGQYWHLTGTTWETISSLTVSMVQLADLLTKTQRPKERR